MIIIVDFSDCEGIVGRSASERPLDDRAILVMIIPRLIEHTSPKHRDCDFDGSVIARNYIRFFDLDSISGI